MDAPVNFNQLGRDGFEQKGSEDSFSISEIVEQLTGLVRRKFPVFVLIVSCVIGLSLVYLFTTPASFTSHAMLLIDSSKVRVLQQQQAPINDVPIDTAHVETQVEILKSENIGLSVIKELKLTDDPEFVGTRGGLFGAILGYFSPAGVQSESRLVRQALATFVGRRAIKRVGLTYVLDIGFTSFDPARAAAIANAIADAYIVDQLEAKYQATRRASVWLQDRIKELRQQASDADRAVLDYKEKNKIVAVGGNSPGGPRLLGEQQLEELNTQLGTARAAAEEAKARLDRINEVMKKDVPDATVADTLHSEVINRLRNSYLDIAAKESIWSARYGHDHLAAVNLRTQMAEIRKSILDELDRIAQSYKSDYEIAKSRVDGLERSLQRLVADSQVTNRDRLGLRDLESTAQVYHTIYDNFLQRYMEAIQQQSFPITEARVISAAVAPQVKSGPPTLTVLGIAGVIGVIFSFGVAMLSEAADQVFRTARQTENTLHINCLGTLPTLVDASKSLKTSSPKSPPLVRRIGSIGGVFGYGAAQGSVTAASEREIGKTSQSRASDVFTSVLSRAALETDSVDASGAPARSRLICFQKAFMRQVVDEPLSVFAEAVRSIKVAADISGSGNNKAIGITSTVPGEGKSTVASNLAELIAHAGNRVILLDGDLRNPTLTRSLTQQAKVGLLEILNKQVALNDAICVDEETGLHFLPSVVPLRLAHTSEILASDSFKGFIDELRKSYDYIIIDFPPIMPVVDVRATTKIVDSYIYVIEWGKTRKSVVQGQLAAAPEIRDRLLGVVLNKANFRVMGRYEGHNGRYYNEKYYGQYGYSA